MFDINKLHIPNAVTVTLLVASILGPSNIIFYEFFPVVYSKLDTLKLLLITAAYGTCWNIWSFGLCSSAIFRMLKSKEPSPRIGVILLMASATNVLVIILTMVVTVPIRGDRSLGETLTVMGIIEACIFGLLLLGAPDASEKEAIKTEQEP